MFTLLIIVTLNETSKTILCCFIVISHSLFAISWVYYFLQELRKKIRKAFPRTYMFLFLCCKVRKLEQEIIIEDFQTTNLQPLLVNIEETLTYLKSRLSMYKSGSIPRENEALAKLLRIGAAY